MRGGRGGGRGARLAAIALALAGGALVVGAGAAAADPAPAAAPAGASKGSASGSGATATATGSGATATGSGATATGSGAHPASDDGVFERDQVEVGPAKHPIRAITIDNPLGDVRVEGHDGKTVQIVAVKRAPDDATLDRLRVSLVPDPDGAVRIVTTVAGGREAPPTPRGAVRIDLIVRAPRDARVDGRVVDGRLELHDMDAGAELDAADGTIAVDNVSGPVFARSLDGDQTFKTVFGIVDAQAMSADLRLDTVRGDRLVAAVNAGRIEGHHIASRKVELRTTRGDIVFDGDAAAGGEIVVASLRGDVAVTLHGGVPVRVHATGAHVTLPPGGAQVAAAPGDLDYDATGAAGGRAKALPTALEIRSRFGTVSFALAQ